MKIIYFELNNNLSQKGYFLKEPFSVWMNNDFNIYFQNNDWVVKNQLCVLRRVIGRTVNFCVTATEEWVFENCPNLLTTYKDLLRFPNKDGLVYGQFDDEFLEYNKNNIGITENYK